MGKWWITKLFQGRHQQRPASALVELGFRANERKSGGKLDPGSDCRARNLAKRLFNIRLDRDTVVRLLLKTGRVNVNSKDYGGRTPISLAAENGREAVVRLLIRTGQAESDSKDCDGWTPLLWAARNGHDGVMKLLIKTGKVEVDPKDERSQTPLSWAARNGHREEVDRIKSFSSHRRLISSEVHPFRLTSKRQSSGRPSN